MISRDEPDFDTLMRACCAASPVARKQTRDAFRDAWHPYLEAALARVADDWTLVESIYPQVYADYARIFERRFEARVDYPTWLLATAYARLAEARGQRPLADGASDLQWPPQLTPIETDVLLFCAILGLPDACRFHLLEAAFPAPQRHVGRIRGWLERRTHAEDPRVTACLRPLVAKVNQALGIRGPQRWSGEGTDEHR